MTEQPPPPDPAPAPPPQTGATPGDPQQPIANVHPGDPQPHASYPGYPQPDGAYPGYPQPDGPHPGHPQPHGAYPGYPPPDGAYPGYPPHASYPGYPPPGGYDYAGYQPQPGGPYPGYQPGYGRPAPGLSGLAVASLVFGIIGFVVPAAGLGIGALVTIRKSGERGRGLAIAGISLAGVWLAAVLTVIVVVLATAPWDDRTGSAGLDVGDCVNDVQGARPVVPCRQPHDGEVYAILTLPDGPWPGQAAVTIQAEQRCLAELPGYVAEPAHVGRLRSTYLLPDQGSWPDDRSVICIARDPAGPTTGSLGG